MIRKLLIALAGFLAFSVPALAQNAASNSPRVQGVPAGFGDPVQVTIRSADGSAVGGVAGDVAAGAADSGNPVKQGCVYTPSPASVSNGQRANVWCSPQGAIVVAASNQGSGADSASAGVLQIATSDAASSGRLATVGFTYNGSTFDRMRGDTNGIVVQNGLTSTQWNFATTGILNNTTTGVTIKAAAGVGVKNYIDSCQFTTTAFGASVPLAIRDGAGGGIKWALVVPTAGWLQAVTMTFDTPISSTANTLLEIATTTANTTGSIAISCQGHTGP